MDAAAVLQPRGGQVSEALEVATGGTIDRQDKCPQCGHFMQYRVDDAESVIASYCCNPDCPLFLVEVEE